MKPTIVARGLKLSRTLRKYVMRRLRFALNRTQHNIHAAIVRITDLNGQKGGIDKRCQIKLSLPGLPMIIVNEKGVDLIAAIDQAAHRAALAVDRSLTRAKEISHTKYKVAPSESVLIY